MDLSTELAAVKAQLKEQTHQMTEMASMMKSMILAVPLLEEQAHKLQKENEEKARKKAVEELERKSKAVAEQLVKERVERQAERAKAVVAKVEADKVAEQMAQVRADRLAERAAKAAVEADRVKAALAPKQLVQMLARHQAERAKAVVTNQKFTDPFAEDEEEDVDTLSVQDEETLAAQEAHKQWSETFRQKYVPRESDATKQKWKAAKQRLEAWEADRPVREANKQKRLAEQESLRLAKE